MDHIRIRKIARILLAVASSCFALWPLVSTAQTKTHVVVLRNGSVFEGKISKIEHRLRIDLATGGQVTISAKRVDFVSGSLDEAYEFQAGRIPQHDAAGRIKLARWCLDQDMVNQAADQLLLAMRIAPNNPLVSSFERELVASQRKLTVKPAATAKKMQRSASKTNHVADEDLATFTTVIQPLLWNRCGAASCHGARSKSDYQLAVPMRGTVPNRRMTKYNLRETLKQVEIGSVKNSPLLVSARMSHGNMDARRGGLDLNQYEQLLKWITSATKDMTPEVIAESKTSPMRKASFNPSEGWWNSVEVSKTAEPQEDPFDPYEFNAQQGHSEPPRQSPSESDIPWWEVDR